MINSAKSYTLDEYNEILRRRIWYLVIPFIVIVIGASGYAIFAPRVYKAGTTVLVTPQRIPENFVQATVTSKVEERLQSIAQEVLSRTRLEQVMNELKLYQKEQKTLSREEVYALMQKDIKVELPTKKEDKAYFVINYMSRDPNLAATVANRLASQFIEENLKLREQQAEGTTEFLATELTSSKAKLDALETTVTQYKRRFMGELPEQRDANIKILDQLQNQYQRLGESLRAAQDRKLLIQKQLTEMESLASMQGISLPEKEEPLPSETPGETAGSYESQKEALTRALDDLRLKYTENHPDVIIMKRRLADLETKKDQLIAKDAKMTKVAKVTKSTKDAKDAYDIKKDARYRELGNQLATTDLEIKRFREAEQNIEAQIGNFRARIERTPAREQDMASLLREYQSTKATYESLLKKSQDAQQAENLEKRQKGEQFRIVDPARVPEKPFSPDVLKILLIGLLAGIGGGFALVFLREQLDRSFHEASDVEITLGLKVLATIPRIAEKEA